MDPISIGLLTALAGGAGGEAGKHAWQALSGLVRRTFGEESGTRELAALERSPNDVAQASALQETLTTRAALDNDFALGLQAWAEHAGGLHVERSETTNTISGTVHGGAAQGRDFGTITFNSGDGS